MAAKDPQLGMMLHAIRESLPSDVCDKIQDLIDQVCTEPMLPCTHSMIGDTIISRVCHNTACTASLTPARLVSRAVHRSFRSVSSSPSSSSCSGSVLSSRTPTQATCAVRVSKDASGWSSAACSLERSGTRPRGARRSRRQSPTSSPTPTPMRRAMRHRHLGSSPLPSRPWLRPMLMVATPLLRTIRATKPRRPRRARRAARAVQPARDRPPRGAAATRSSALLGGSRVISREPLSQALRGQVLRACMITRLARGGWEASVAWHAMVVRRGERQA